MTYFNEKKVGDPKWIAGDEEHEAALAESGVSVDAASRIAGRPIRWLAENIVPYDAVTVIAGEPGAGKTFFACQLAADAARESQLRVVLATSGSESPELLRWRLDQAEGDARRIALANLTPNGFKDRRANPSDEMIDERLSILYYTLEAAGDPKSGVLPAEINLPDESVPRPRAAGLLVIDDVDGWFGKPGNLLSAAALARVIQRLNELAQSLHVAIVVLARTQLSVEGRITSRQLSRLSQAASVVWMLVKDRGQRIGDRAQGESGRGRDDERRSPRAYRQSARRWFMPVKNNLSPDAATFGRSFELVDGQIRWHGDDPAPSLAEAMLTSAHNTDRRRERRAAAVWIAEALAAGPMPSNDFYQQGIECGYSKGTLHRAASELGIHSHKTGFNGGWEVRWVPQPVARGQGSRARAQGSGFRIFGGDGERGRSGDKEMGRKGDGATEGRSEGGSGDLCGLPSTVSCAPFDSCAPSLKCEEFEETSCAPSQKCGEIEETSCGSSNAAVLRVDQPVATEGPHHAERDDYGKAEVTASDCGANCASSQKCEENEATNCAPSSEGQPDDAIQNPKLKAQNPLIVNGLPPTGIREAC
jgi:hypothetical protein